MVFVGDYFAIALVFILGIFYFEGNGGHRYMNRASKCFVTCLIMTAATALTDIITGQLLLMRDVPLWLNMTLNSLYFILNIFTTSSIALFLFTKILEHSHDNHCMAMACRGLAILFVLYLAALIINLWTGWVFYFDGDGNYCRGPLNAIGYFITICQMALVTVCYFRNSRNVGRQMRRVLLQIFPVGLPCIVIQRLHPDIILNCFLLSMVEAVLFITFQGQRQGVHSLTKLNDRHRFFKEVEQRISRGERFQVLLINIKNFSVINQKYGHLFGDEFLYQFSFDLEKLIKKAQTFHMNGTVFSLVLPYAEQAAAEKSTGVLMDFLEQGITCMDRQISLDYIVVEYIADELDSSAAEFYENLEYAAARAHRQKLRYIRYTHAIGAQMNRERYLGERLQTIDRKHGYEVWYQPVCCMDDGKFCSMEALVRLREPDGSMISPAEFIPLAERTDRVAPITWFVLEEVCSLLRCSPELADVSVSVNLPMAQLLEKGFAARLDGIVDGAGIAHRRICLEFTERAILENFEKTMEIMMELADKGYRFFLDDFGTGYSNFNCLLQLPFRIIKLDACLVRPILDGRDDYAAVRTLTKLFHDMKLEVIAEGAESMDEVEALREQGVDRIQGYALARPMPDAKLLDFYRALPSCPCE